MIAAPFEPVVVEFLVEVGAVPVALVASVAPVGAVVSLAVEGSVADNSSELYAVFDEPPVVGKDVNDQLQMRVGLKCKEEYSR